MLSPRSSGQPYRKLSALGAVVSPTSSGNGLAGEYDDYHFTFLADFLQSFRPSPFQSDIFPVSIRSSTTSICILGKMRKIGGLKAFDSAGRFRKLTNIKTSGKCSIAVH